MLKDEFDDYRRRYVDMTSDELKGWHSRLYAEYPNQSHFNKEAVVSFLSGVDHLGAVLEYGGWDGELAEFVMQRAEVDSWVNCEICTEAIENSVCSRPEYRPINSGYPCCGKCDTLVLSHVLEHLSDGQAVELLVFTPAKRLYIDTPLKSEGQDWSGTTCFHVLEFGWDSLERLVLDQGFSEGGRHSYTCRWYVRE